QRIYSTEQEAIAAARAVVAWLSDVVDRRRRSWHRCMGERRMTLDTNARETLDTWHRMVATGDLSQVGALCAPDAVFRSPVAHTHYRGAGLVAASLQQAAQTFGDFRYHRTVVSGDRDVVLEFSAKVGDKDLKGIDMIRFDEAGRIVDFEVMVRPASGLQ